MTPWVEVAELAALVGVSMLFAVVPRRLFARLGPSPSSGQTIMLAGGVAGLSFAIFLLGTGLAPGPRLALAVAAAACVATVHADLRYLVVPDILSGALALLALVAPAEGSFAAAIGGGLIAAGLLGVLRWVWRRAFGIDGLGFGDVKLALGLGGLLGAQAMLWVITAAALLGVVWGLLRHARGDERPQLPFGALLAAVAGVALVWTRL